MSLTIPAHESSPPDPWISGWLVRLPRGARILDFASGRARHARLAVDFGLEAVAADRDEAALSRAGPGVRTVCCDLETGAWPFAPDSFDAVIVSNYLFRPRLDLLCGLIRPTGVLLYQTFALGNEAFGRPRNPDFLLRDGELLRLAARNGLRVLEFREGLLGEPPRACIQRIAAQRPPPTPACWPIAG